jgi:centromere protein I
MLTKYPELHKTILLHLDRAVLASAHSPFETLCEFYANLSNRWMKLLVAEEGKVSPDILSTHQQAVVELSSHISAVTLSALATTDSANTAILNLLESTAFSMRDALAAGSRALPLIVPPPHTLYLLAMSSRLSDLDRICSLIAAYKQAYTSEVRISRQSFQEHIDRFNGYLMDICNLLWRSQALTSDENVLDRSRGRPRLKATTLGCMCPAEVFSELQAYVNTVEREYNIGSVFGFSHNPSTSMLARSTMASLEAAEEIKVGHPLSEYHAGPVTSNSLEVLRSQGGLEISWTQFRAAVLDSLEAKGAKGIKELMWATMKKELTSLR